MGHPYKDKAKESHNSKAKSMGKENNLVIPTMRAAGENKAGGIRVSSSSGQHQDQAKAPGMKRGGGLSAYPLKKHGAGGGLGRLDKAK